MSDKSEELNFEQTLENLEQIVERLERGDLSLEDSLKLFEEGQLLAKVCNEKLESAALRIEQLTSDGEIIELDVQ